MQIRRLVDGCQTKRKVLHERITHHCLRHVFTVRNVISDFNCVVLSHKIHSFKPNDKRLFSNERNPWIEINASHNTSLWSLVARVTRVYFSRETKGMKIHRKLVTLISKTFHRFSRSSADNKRRTRSYGHL